MTQENPGDMSTPPPPAPPPPPPAAASTDAGGGIFAPPTGDLPTADTPDSKTMAMLAHLLAVFTGFVGPLVIWLIKKDQSKFVDDQGKEALNFQITMLIAHLIAGALWMVCIGVFITTAILIVNAVFCIMAALKANQGIAYRYPFNIRLVK